MLEKLDWVLASCWTAMDSAAQYIPPMKEKVSLPVFDALIVIFIGSSYLTLISIINLTYFIPEFIYLFCWLWLFIVILNICIPSSRTLKCIYSSSSSFHCVTNVVNPSHWLTYIDQLFILISTLQIETMLPGVTSNASYYGSVALQSLENGFYYVQNASSPYLAQVHSFLSTRVFV